MKISTALHAAKKLLKTSLFTVYLLCVAIQTNASTYLFKQMPVSISYYSCTGWRSNIIDDIHISVKNKKTNQKPIAVSSTGSF
jgi:hypothetical protein